MVMIVTICGVNHYVDSFYFDVEDSVNVGVSSVSDKHQNGIRCAMTRALRRGVH